jgi:hypothetical protein
MGMTGPGTLLLSVLILLLPLSAQQIPPDPLAFTTKELPKARLWDRYVFEFQTSGGIPPYGWQVVAGTPPRNLVLNDSGVLVGVVDQPGKFDFTVLVHDDERPPKQQRQKFVVDTEAPLLAEWDHKAQVNGQRIEGSVKVSNQTGRDFDLTFIVLAVNEIGRATAIGYQHFWLKKNTRDLALPFGETLSTGNYVANVDVVGEEPISNQIFRARLVTARESITQGP